jgi:steroid delta-isomerase-like uncharacterized protein
MTATLMESPRDVVLAWVDAFNRRDAAAAAALYHEEAINFQVATGEPTTGRQAMLDEFAYFFRAFPDNYTRPVSLFEDGEWAILEWEGGGTWKGEFAGHQPNGRSFTLRGAASSTSSEAGSSSSVAIGTKPVGSASSTSAEVSRPSGRARLTGSPGSPRAHETRQRRTP